MSNILDGPKDKSDSKKNDEHPDVKKDDLDSLVKKLEEVLGPLLETEDKKKRQLEKIKAPSRWVFRTMRLDVNNLQEICHVFRRRLLYTKG